MHDELEDVDEVVSDDDQKQVVRHEERRGEDESNDAGDDHPIAPLCDVREAEGQPRNHDQ